ncbi:MAG: T9SS type A sorting domain-containing protein [Bacteroidales bacterium]|nr:T9SS type A sorting domain-containing protein [Bacteroidales bacterium]MBN2761671.1 T9SS type A sorting domain-containing protein [Bacteroidales bacterium]
MKKLLLIALFFAASNLFAQEYYVQFVLNGWSSYIEIPEYEFTEDATSFSAMAKYALGPDNGGYALSQINIFLKLANSDFNVEIGASGASSSDEFKEYTVPVAATGMASRFQVAGQETASWGALTGDTLWVGAITVHTEFDDEVIFNPAEVDPQTLPEGVTIVEIAPSAVDTRNTQQITLYPNPAQSTLTVSGLQHIAEINVVNLAGATVMTVENTHVLNVENLSKGLYFIRVQAGNETLTTKFVKQ